MTPFQQPDHIKDSRVLVAALDWGMGHTTRMVSIIRTLLSNGNRVVFAGNEKQNAFINYDFSEVETVFLDGYSIQLDSRKGTYFQMAVQSGKALKAIRREHKWLASYVSTNQVDCIISDNRYGFYHSEIPSIILTHQLNLQVPKFQKAVSRTIQKWIEKFDVCWVPDFPDRSLTGALSRTQLSIPVSFIGPLCRFKSIKTKKKYDVLVVLSGPEPERTHFLNNAIEAFGETSKSVAFVGDNVAGFDSFVFPSTAELEQLIAQSECIYSRAGYTTIMEMVGLQKKAVLYPTKGQYEQIYLAKNLKSPYIEFRETPNL